MTISISSGTKPYDGQINKYQRINPNGSMLVDSPTREIGGGFGSVADTVQSAFSNVGAGSASGVANNIATLSSGTSNSGYGSINSNAICRFQYSTANFLRGNFRLPSIGGANTTRSWGAFNFGTKPVILDGFYFSYDGSSSTLSVNVANNGVITTINSGAFNGELSSYTLDTNVHAYEIIYQLPAAWFFIDNVLVHKFKATTGMLTNNIHLTTGALASNSVSGVTSASLEIWASSISKMTATEPDPQYAHINTLSTTLVKRDPGTLQRIIINAPGTSSNVLTIYDNVVGSGKVIAAINVSGNTAASFLDYNLPFFIGLTVVSATGASADITIIYD